MFAGMLLGPSLLGWLAPSSFASLFPPGGLAPLYFLSQMGLLLFMFQVGVGLDLQELRRLGRTVVLTSNISVLVRRHRSGIEIEIGIELAKPNLVASGLQQRTKCR